MLRYFGLKGQGSDNEFGKRFEMSERIKKSSTVESGTGAVTDSAWENGHCCFQNARALIAKFRNAAALKAPNYDNIKSKLRLDLLSKGFRRKAAGRLFSFVRFPSHAAAHPFDLLLVRVNGRMRGYMNWGRLPHQLLITP
jgi:hypothetical protein